MDKQREPGDVPGGMTYGLCGLVAWRRFLGVPREVLARESGVSLGMLWLAETGRSLIRGRTVNRIARALDVPASVLVSCGPLDRDGRRWANRAAQSLGARRVVSAQEAELAVAAPAALAASA